MGLLIEARDYVRNLHEDEHRGEANFRPLENSKAEDIINRMTNIELLDILEQLLDR